MSSSQLSSPAKLSNGSHSSVANIQMNITRQDSLSIFADSNFNKSNASTSVGSNSEGNELESKAFAENRSTLVSSIDEASSLLSSLSLFNDDKWTIRYPHQLGISNQSNSSPSTLVRSKSGSTVTTEVGSGDDNRSEKSSTVGKNEGKKFPVNTHEKSFSADVDSPKASTPGPGSSHPLSILSIDLKTSPTGAPSNPSLPSLLPSLSLSTVSMLLSRRLTSSLSHLSTLRSRVLDTSSRILVTGDLNAGKSTLVNAILKRNIMPVDQQPCTESFCEVLDAGKWNGGVEEVHAIRIGGTESYDPKNDSTFERFSLDQLDKVVQLEIRDDEEGDADTEEAATSPYAIIKVYVNDEAPPQETPKDEAAAPSFIKNGLVSISLIDAPGLNRDTLSTTSLFSRQSEIDVIVFVVSAENHFTLSAKEFLWNASREKAYVFVVVNKWQGIRDKVRCKRLVGEQIKQLSPGTWEQRDELVHFVESEKVLEEALKAAEAEENGGEKKVDASFEHLENSLKSFVLLKRSQSKLAPAKHYLLNLLSDLSILADSNVSEAEIEFEKALQELERIKPENERLVKSKEEVEEDIARVEEMLVDRVKAISEKRLEEAIKVIGEGKVLERKDGKDLKLLSKVETNGFKVPKSLPAYPGIMGIWNWSQEIKATLLESLESEVRLVEELSRDQTREGVKEIMVDLGNKFLPDGEKDKNDRVFKPEVMFAKRRKFFVGLGNRNVGTAVGLRSSFGLENADVEISVLDFLDLDRIFNIPKHFNLIHSGKNVEDVETGALSVVSLGVGAMTMFGSKVMGVKGFLEAIGRFADLMGSRAVRKYAGPVVGILTAGLAVYIIIDLPRAVPRNIGRKLQASLTAAPSLSPASILSSTPSTSVELPYSSLHTDRITKETRKVLRLAGWDLRERFRSALERSEKERKEVEANKTGAEAALNWLGDFIEKIESTEGKVMAVDLNRNVTQVV